MKEKLQIKARIHDAFRAFCVGAVISVVLFIIGGITGALAKNQDTVIKAIFQGSASAVFVGGSFGMFIAAFFVLKNKKKNDGRYKKDWREKFQVFTYQGAILCISLVILIFGSLVDGIRYYLL